MLINKENWKKAKEIIVFAEEDNDISKAYTYALGNATSVLVSGGLNCPENMREQNKIRLHKMAENIFAIQRLARSENPDIKTILNQKINSGEPYTEVVNKNGKPYTQYISVSLTGEEEQILIQLAQEIYDLNISSLIDEEYKK